MADIRMAFAEDSRKVGTAAATDQQPAKRLSANHVEHSSGQPNTYSARATRILGTMTARLLDLERR